MTGRPAIERLGQNRQPRRNALHPQPVGGPLDEQLVAAWTRCGEKPAVRVVPQILVAAENAHQIVHAIVVRRHIIVRDGPVVTQAILRLPLKVVRPETQRDPPPVIGPSAEHPGAPPIETRSRCPRVRFAFDVPTADAGVELAERPLPGRGAAAGRGIVRNQHRRIGRVVPRSAGFEHNDIGAGLCERVRRDAAAGAGTDDRHVVGGALGSEREKGGQLRVAGRGARGEGRGLCLVDWRLSIKRASEASGEGRARGNVPNSPRPEPLSATRTLYGGAAAMATSRSNNDRTANDVGFAPVRAHVEPGSAPHSGSCRRPGRGGGKPRGAHGRGMGIRAAREPASGD